MPKKAVKQIAQNDESKLDLKLRIFQMRTLTTVLHFAIGKRIVYHGKFAVKRTAKSTWANYGKLSRAKHRGKKRSPASHKRMANNGIFTFPGVKASHGLPRYPYKSAAFCHWQTNGTPR